MSMWLAVLLVVVLVGRHLIHGSLVVVVGTHPIRGSLVVVSE